MNPESLHGEDLLKWIQEHIHMELRRLDGSLAICKHNTDILPKMYALAGADYIINQLIIAGNEFKTAQETDKEPNIYQKARGAFTLDLVKAARSGIINEKQRNGALAHA